MERTIQNSSERLQERLILYSPNIVNLCLDSYEKKEQKGRLYHEYIRQPMQFTTLFEAFGMMEKFYDKLQFPQASTILRDFTIDRREREKMIKERGWEMELPERIKEDCKKVEAFEKVIAQKGKEATFVVRVKFRQHSSWQGEVTWVDGQKKEYFRSVLELIKLMDSALQVQG